MDVHPWYLDSPPLALAHRGGYLTGQDQSRENSLAAFTQAQQWGYRYMETDVRASRDGVVYACHDASLARLTGDDRRIEQLDSRELDDLLLGGTEPLVRLEHLLTTLSDVRFNIDVKADDAAMPTCNVIESVRATARVCLASFSDRRLATLRRRLPRAAFSASPLQVLRLRAGLGVPRGVDCVQVPARQGPLQVVTPEFVRRTHAAGIQVHVWTVNNAAQMSQLLDSGVDGIVSDRIDVLKDVLSSRGQWRS